MTSTHKHDELEIPLEGGSGAIVIRRGDVVLRAPNAWTPTVHALLKHLENVGFDGAPRVVNSGFDAQGREMLTYIEGKCCHLSVLNDDALIAVGQMIRDLHKATALFRIPDGAVWRPWFGRECGGAERVIGHCDAAPWNIIARGSRPVGLIDWEFAGPVDPLTELAQVCWVNVQLYDDDIAAKVGLPDADMRAKQVRLIADSYGLPAAGRRELTNRMIDFAAQAAANEVIDARITPDSKDPAPLWAIAWRARSVAWMLRHRALLEGALK